MSVKVDLAQLADALADYTFAYLVTVGDDYRAHTVAVDPVLIGGALEVTRVGNSTRRNVIAHSDVTLVWPPSVAGGYTLIVDGHGECTEAGLNVVASGAVLHRPATPSTPAASGCGDDCLPLTNP